MLISSGRHTLGAVLVLVAIAGAVTLLARSAGRRHQAGWVPRSGTSRPTTSIRAGSPAQPSGSTAQPDTTGPTSQPGQKQLGVLAGVVVDEAGAPAEATVVVLYQPSILVPTRADGRFETQLEAGSWCVHAERPGQVSTSGIADVEEGEQPTRVRLVLHAAARIEGSAYDPDGRPLPGAMVSATCQGVQIMEGSALDRSLHRPRTFLIPPIDCSRAVSDEHGRFTMQVPPGKATLIARADGMAGIELPLETELAQTKEVELRFVHSSVISGRVTDRLGRPIAGGKILNTNLSGGHTTTDADGRFILDTEADDEEVVLYASATGYSVESGRYFRASPSPLDFVLTASGMIRGVVRGPDGSPVAGVHVGQYDSPLSQVIPADFLPPNSPVTRADGTFEIKEAWAGHCVVIATQKGFAHSASAPVEVAPGDTVEGVLITLGNGATFRVKILDAGTRQPLKGAQIERYVDHGGDDYYTDAQGAFQFDRLAPGHYTFGFGDARHPGKLMELDLAQGDDVEREILLEQGCEVALRADFAGKTEHGFAYGGHRLDGWGKPGWDESPEGNPIVHVAVPGVYSFNAGAKDQRGRWMQRDVVLVLRDEIAVQVRFRFDGGKCVRGRVTRAGSLYTEGLWILEQARSPGLVFAGKVGEDGRFEFGGLDPGDYFVLSSPPDGWKLSPVDGRGGFEVAQDCPCFHVPEEGDSVEVNIDLPASR